MRLLRKSSGHMLALVARQVWCHSTVEWLRLGWRRLNWDFGMQLELRPFQGLRVLHVAPGGAADRAGLEAGDLIAGTTMGSFRRVLCEAEALQQLELAVHSAQEMGGPSVTVYVQDRRAAGVMTAELHPRRARGRVGTEGESAPILGR